MESSSEMSPMMVLTVEVVEASSMFSTKTMLVVLELSTV
jgi:hypothetical protein